MERAIRCAHGPTPQHSHACVCKQRFKLRLEAGHQDVRTVLLDLTTGLERLILLTHRHVSAAKQDYTDPSRSPQRIKCSCLLLSCPHVFASIASSTLLLFNLRYCLCRNPCPKAWHSQAGRKVYSAASARHGKEFWRVRGPALRGFGS